MPMKKNNSTLKETITIQVENIRDHNDSSPSKATSEYKNKNISNFILLKFDCQSMREDHRLQNLESVTKSKIAHYLLTEDEEPLPLYKATKSMNISMWMIVT